MKKILILGSSGYIGSRVSDWLTNAGHDVSGVDLGWHGVRPGSIKLDYRALSADVIQQADVVILLAGHSSVRQCDGDIQHSWRNNVSNFVELVGKMTRSQQLIYASSGSVYGNTGSQVFNAVNNYDITKYVLDLEARRLMDQGYKLLGLRFGTVNGYSPVLRSDLMINAMLTRAWSEGQININNKYIQRPILALADLCRAMEAMIELPVPRSGIYDLCSFNTRVVDVAQAVAQATDASVLETQDRAGVYDFVMSNQPFEREFSFKFQADVHSIIEELTWERGNWDSADRNTPREYL